MTAPACVGCGLRIKAEENFGDQLCTLCFRVLDRWVRTQDGKARRDSDPLCADPVAVDAWLEAGKPGLDAPKSNES